MRWGIGWGGGVGGDRVGALDGVSCLTLSAFISPRISTAFPPANIRQFRAHSICWLVLLSSMSQISIVVTSVVFISLGSLVQEFFLATGDLFLNGWSSGLPRFMSDNMEMSSVRASAAEDAWASSVVIILVAP